MPLPKTGTVQVDFGEHLKFDAVSPSQVAGAAYSWDFMESVLGHRSGLRAGQNQTPWEVIPARPQAAGLTDTGTASATTATTLTDGTKAWVTNEWVGRTIFAILAANAVTKMVVTSNTATVLTGTAWTNGTPGNVLYQIMPDASLNSKFYDNWYATLRALGNPDSL